MKQKLLPLSIVALLAVLFVVISFSWYDDQGKVVSTDFPQKTAHRVELRPESDKEVIRVNYVNKTGQTQITEIQYTNGVTSYLFLREDGQTLAKVLDFYPEDSVGQTDRKLKAETYYTDSGDALANHTVYREDGSVLRRGQRQADDTYKTIHFAEDGISVVRQRSFDEDQDLISDYAYFPDGSVQIKVEKDGSSGSNYVTTTFREDGSKFSEAKSSYYNFTGTFFWEDGVTVKAKFESSSYRLEVEQHNKSGVHEFTATYRSDDMTVERVNDEGQVLYEQVYNLVGEREGVQCQGDYKLIMVSEYHKWGKQSWQKKTFKIVEFAEDGVTPVKIVVPTSKYLKYVYTLDENGVVVKVDEDGTRNGYGAGDSEDGAVSFKVGDKVVIAPELLEVNKFECLPLPEKVDTNAPTPYMYYGPF